MFFKKLLNFYIPITISYKNVKTKKYIITNIFFKIKKKEIKKEMNIFTIIISMELLKGKVIERIIIQ